MKLYGSGFNAWNQLRFSTEPGFGQPDDISQFEVILEGGHIEPPISTIAHTSVRCDGKQYVAGHVDYTDANGVEGGRSFPSAENFAGQVLQVEQDSEQHDEAAATGYSLVKYTRLASAPGETSRQPWPRTKPIKQIAAFHVGFIILYEDGSVETLGDPRFVDCLGRGVDDENPADEPCTVLALSDLDDPVSKVTAGGYTVAALTESGALYLWGMGSPGGGSKLPIIVGLDDVPNYFEVDGDKDVRDIALGEYHAISLTADGCVYVIGGNEDGQLGLGKDAGGRIDSWTRVNLHLPSDQHVVRVASGPRASFILASH